MLRVQNGGYGAAIKHAKEVWNDFYSGYPIEVFFLDDSVDFFMVCD